jgi:hypothetical protein
VNRNQVINISTQFKLIMHNNFSFKLLLAASLLTSIGLLINGCDNEKDATPNQAVTKSIGNEGGELKGSDGILTLAIPNGAIPAETKVGIQVTNEVAANGIGKVYTLTPEGTEFTKPVSVSLQYTDEDIKDIAPARLAIAYKKDDNTWQVMRTLISDNTTKTVTTETTHFSQWSLIDGAPVITGIDPLSANSNEITTISIIGVNFSPTPSENIVTLNGLALTVATATSTTLLVTLPAGGSTGKIQVEVNGNAVESNESLTILEALPTITSFSPASADEDFDTNVIITGTNFSSVPSENIVTLNGVTLTVFSATNTTLSVIIPSGLTSGQLKVSVDGEEVTSTDSFTVISTSPTITSFSPTSAKDDVTTDITINGSNFSSITTENTVTLNGLSLMVVAVTANVLQARAPIGATTGKIQVTVKNKTALSAGDFTIISTTPTITNFSPTSAADNLTTNVAISGSNFSMDPSQNVVMLNGVNLTVATVTTISASEMMLIVIIPPGNTTASLTIIVNGKNAVSKDNFIVISTAPTITGFSPESGVEGLDTSITITGTNFSTTSANNLVSINGNSLTVISATSTQLSVTIPSGVRTGPITVTVNGKSALSDKNFILVKPEPIIESFSPTSAQSGIITTVIITGMNFSPELSENSASLNGLQLTVASVTTTALVVIVPAGASSGPIQVSVSGVTVVSSSNFTIN